MKKLFISCPMRGRTNKDILNTRYKLYRIAQIIFDEELEVIDSYIYDGQEAENDSKTAIWYLGESVKKMADADYFIGMSDSYDYKGCQIEHDVAILYDIPKCLIDSKDVAPDAHKKVEEEFKEKYFGKLSGAER